MWPRSQLRMLQLNQILQRSNGFNLRISLNTEFSNLLTEAPGVLQTSFSIILNSPQTSPLDQDLTQHLIRHEKITEKWYCWHDQNGSYLRSISPYASPVVVVKKKSKKTRVGVEKLNELTVFDPEPMPTAEHLFQKLAKKLIGPVTTFIQKLISAR